MPPRRQVGPAHEELQDTAPMVDEEPVLEAIMDGSHPADKDKAGPEADRLFKELFAEEIADAAGGSSTDALPIKDAKAPDPAAESPTGACKTNIRSRCYLDTIAELFSGELIQGLPFASRWPAARALWSASKGNDLKALKALNEAILKAKEEPISELPADQDGKALRAHVDALVIDLRAKVRANGGCKPGCPRCRYNKKGCPPSCINRRLKGRKTHPGKAKAKATAEAGSESEASSDLP